MTDLHEPPILDPHFSDSYVISQDISALQYEARVRGYLSGQVVPYVPGLPSGPVDSTVVIGELVPQHPADYVTMTGLLNAISDGPQSHDGTRKGRGRAPMWALVSLFSGLVLVGASMVGWAWLSMQ